MIPPKAATISPAAVDSLGAGLAGFVAVSEAALAEAVRLILRTTRRPGEGTGAAGLAGLLNLRATLAGHAVGVVLQEPTSTRKPYGAS
jgi:threonine dehydratase